MHQFKFILLIILNGFLSDPPTFAASRNQLTNDPSGVISFEKSAIDFGTMKRGEKQSAKFVFKNSGGGPLVIQGVQAPCDCTTVEASKGKTIAPGQSGVIEVIFDSTDYAGRVTKALTVVTNERSMPDRTLTISALVNSDLEADPPLVDFGEVLANQVPQQQIRIRNFMKSELKIEKLKYNEDYLDVGYNKDGKDWVLHVKLKASAPIGFLKDTIYVKNNSPALPDLPVPVRATIKGHITPTPSYLEFGSIASKDTSARQISLKSVEDFEVTSHKVDIMINGNKRDDANKFLKVSVMTVDAKNKNVNLELANAGAVSGSVHGKITLETSNLQQKSVVVDFYAFFR